MSDALKREAARAALGELPARGVIGLGSGSTARLFVDELATKIRGGAAFVGVPTSAETRAFATSLGIPLLDDEGPWELDVTVDGADEVDPQRNMIKGGGAAHTREKIVNASSRRNVIVVDESKLSAKLGTLRAVPVEVLPFGHGATAKHLATFGAVTLRAKQSDAGNPLYDVTTGPIDDPAALERALRAIPGVVEVGLFVQRADVVIVAGASGVRRV